MSCLEKKGEGWGYLCSLSVLCLACTFFNTCLCTFGILMKDVVPANVFQMLANKSANTPVFCCMSARDREQSPFKKFQT